MKKLVLHETGELPKLRNVTAEKVDALHHPEDAPHFAFARNDGLEYLPRFPCVAKRAGHDAQITREEVGEVRAQIQLPFLGQLKGPHHPFRMLHEIGSGLRKELPVANAKRIDAFFPRFQTRQKPKE